MLTQDQLLSATHWLLRFVRATDPVREAVLMENQRIAAGIKMVRERSHVYRDLYPTIASAVRIVAGEAAGSLGGRVMRLERREVLYKVRDLLQPNGGMAHIGAIFAWSARGGVTMRPVMLSLPLEFGITLAELMREHPSVRVYRCKHSGCHRMWAVKMGRDTGKGRKSHHCAAHEPDTTKSDRATRQQKPKKRKQQ